MATGSFNLSRNATLNTENSLIVHDATLAGQYSTYLETLAATYRSAGR